ncbi:MAG TPA: hypothetical protein VF053_15045 [Streptosporangiales bacterium]
MSGRHRTGRGSRRAGWSLAGACAGAVVLGASLTAVVVNHQPPAASPGTDPETGVSLRTYPVPVPSASPSDVARNLREVDTEPPATRTSHAAAPDPTPSRTPQPSVTEPARRRPKPEPTRVCDTFRYRGHTYRYCSDHSHPPHP